MLAGLLRNFARAHVSALELQRDEVFDRQFCAQTCLAMAVTVSQ